MFLEKYWVSTLHKTFSVKQIWSWDRSRISWLRGQLLRSAAMRRWAGHPKSAICSELGLLWKSLSLQVILPWSYPAVTHWLSVVTVPAPVLTALLEKWVEFGPNKITERDSSQKVRIFIRKRAIYDGASSWLLRQLKIWTPLSSFLHFQQQDHVYGGQDHEFA